MLHQGDRSIKKINTCIFISNRYIEREKIAIRKLNMNNNTQEINQALLKSRPPEDDWSHPEQPYNQRSGMPASPKSEHPQKKQVTLTEKRAAQEREAEFEKAMAEERNRSGGSGYHY